MVKKSGLVVCALVVDMEEEAASSSPAVAGNLPDDIPNTNWTCDSLKKFLRNRGGHLTGKKKELVERALFYHKNPEAAKAKRSQVKQSVVDASSGKIGNFSDASLAPVFPMEGWSICPSSFPAVTFLTILDHLSRSGKTTAVREGSEDGIFISMRPLDRANEFFFGGYVHDVSVCKQETLAFVKGSCWASQKKAVRYHQKVRLCCLQEGDNIGEYRVDYATCMGCVAGTDGGVCSHVFALLMVLERYRTTVPTSVTSLPRSWGPRQRDIRPEPVSQIVVERANLKRKGGPVGCSLYEARSPRLRQFDTDDLDRVWEALPDNCSLKDLMLSPDLEYTSTPFGRVPTGSPLSYQLKSHTSPDPSTIKKPSTSTKNHPRQFPRLPMPPGQNQSVKAPTYPVSLLDAQALEQRTTGQSSCQEWIALHQYTLTASNFKRIGHCSAGTDSILKSLFDGGDLSHVPAIKHGKDNESVALLRYVDLQADNGKSVSVRRCGLVLDTNHRYLGASPDAMVFDPVARPHYGLVEIKCPYSAHCKGLTVEQAAMEDRAFCIEHVSDRLQLKRSHAFYWQVQGQLAICRLKWCDFFVWIGNSCFVERIHADSALWVDTMLPKLEAFYFNHAVPYLRLHSRTICTPSSDVTPAQFETLLPEDLCQSRIDGRNGSNACTFIATLFVKNALLTASYSSDEVMCRAMRDGNAMYDATGEVCLFSVDEVLHQGQTGLGICQESFVRPTAASFKHMVELMSAQANRSASGVFGGIFVLTPYSFSMLCHQDKFILFDSHCHGDHGALLSVVPVEHSVLYLEHFFSHFYPGLKFDSRSQNLAAHITFLSLLEGE